MKTIFIHSQHQSLILNVWSNRQKATNSCWEQHQHKNSKLPSQYWTPRKITVWWPFECYFIEWKWYTFHKHCCILCIIFRRFSNCPTPSCQWICGEHGTRHHIDGINVYQADSWKSAIKTSPMQLSCQAARQEHSFSSMNVTDTKHCSTKTTKIIGNIFLFSFAVYIFAASIFITSTIHNQWQCWSKWYKY